MAWILGVVTLMVGHVLLAWAAVSFGFASNLSGYCSADELERKEEGPCCSNKGHHVMPVEIMALHSEFGIVLLHGFVVISALLTWLMISFIEERPKTAGLICQLLGRALLIGGGTAWMIGCSMFPVVEERIGGGSCGGKMREVIEHVAVLTGVTGTSLGRIENVVTPSFGVQDGVFYLIAGIILWIFTPPSDTVEQTEHAAGPGTSPIEQLADPRQE